MKQPLVDIYENGVLVGSLQRDQGSTGIGSSAAEVQIVNLDQSIDTE